LTIENKINDLSRTEENHYINDEVHENLVTVIPSKYIFKLYLFKDDSALWIVNETTKDHFSFNGFNQNLENNDFSKSKRLSTKRMRGAQCSYYRYFSFKLIKTKIINNESFNRTFLLVLVTERKENKKYYSMKIRLLINLVFLKCLRGSVVEQIDKQLILQVETEKMYWEKELTRVAAVVKSLSSRRLPLRGHDDKFGSTHKLIAEFDLFLFKHIAQYANKGKGSTSYLSFATKKLLYIKKNGEPVERFLQFFANAGHKSEDMADAIFMALGANDLDIKNCRGQSYDNASNMSGMYSGLQARIKEASIHTVYIPCAAHSLNLVGECEPVAVHWQMIFLFSSKYLYIFFFFN
ncbi:hypothetical protein AGLY_017698, partial [Aphis glycines]